MYNVERYIDRCIKSLLSQDMDDYEIILVDDKSTDSTLCKAEKWISCDKIFIIKKDSHSGLSDTRNVGLNAARSEYIIFVDSDDYVESNGLGTMKEMIIQAYFPDAFYVEFEEHRTADSMPSLGFVSHRNRSYTGKEFFTNELKSEKLWVSSCTGTYKRTFLIENGLYFKPGILNEDELWTPQVLLCARSIYYSNQLWYHYVRREGSITSRHSDTKRGIDVINAAEQLYKTVSDIDDQDLRRLFKNHLANLYLEGVAIGQLYRKPISRCLDRFFPLKNAFYMKETIKAMVYMLSPYMYCRIRYYNTKRCIKRKVKQTDG